MANNVYQIESSLRKMATVRGSLVDARKKAMRLIGDKNMVLYIYREFVLVGLVRDWYAGQYQWFDAKGKAYILSEDGKLKYKSR